MSEATMLVAGAAGLIGSSLCRRLLANGKRVLALDNFLTGSRQNLEALMSNPHFCLIEHDLQHPLPDLPWTPQGIFHLASPASPDDFGPLAMEIMNVNTSGTHKLLDLARSCGAKVLFASTSEVYGNPQVHPQREDYWGYVNTLGPRSCYDESKRFGESLITHYARLFDVPYVLTRIFNTYGPRMRADDGRVVPNFLLAALRRQELLLHGGGQHTRSFCYVEDLSRGLELLMDAQASNGEVFNLGNPHEFTIETLATAICEVAGIPVQLKSIPSPRQDDPERRCPDIGKIQNLLGWQPEVELREGLTLTYQDFKERFQNRL